MSNWEDFKDKENLCSKCKHLVDANDEGMKTCELDFHKDYIPINKCKKFKRGD